MVCVTPLSCYRPGGSSTFLQTPAHRCRAICACGDPSTTRNEYVNGSSRLTLCGSRKVTHHCGPAAVDGVASYRRCMSVSAMWISSVTIGAANPRELASFYERLLGWTIATVEG